MGLFRFADDGGEIVVFQNGTVESVRRSLCGFAGKVELERGKAFEAQLFGKATTAAGEVSQDTASSLAFMCMASLP